MDPLTLFGLFAVTLMLITYALEDRSPWFILAFAAACALASVYGFLQAHGPLGSLKRYSQELQFGDGELARRFSRRKASSAALEKDHDCGTRWDAFLGKAPIVVGLFSSAPN